MKTSLSFTVLKIALLAIPAVFLFQNCGPLHLEVASSSDIPPCTSVTCGTTLDNKEFYSKVSEKAFARGRSNSALSNR